MAHSGPLPPAAVPHPPTGRPSRTLPAWVSLASSSLAQVSGYLNLLANTIDNFTHGLAVAASFLVSKKVSRGRERWAPRISGGNDGACINQLARPPKQVSSPCTSHSITNTLIQALRAARGCLLSEPLGCSCCECSLLGLHTSAKLLGLGPACF